MKFGHVIGKVFHVLRRDVHNGCIEIFVITLTIATQTQNLILSMGMDGVREFYVTLIKCVLFTAHT